MIDCGKRREIRQMPRSLPEHLGRKKVRCDGKGREPWRRESIHKRLWGVYKEAR